MFHRFFRHAVCTAGIIFFLARFSSGQVSLGVNLQSFDLYPFQVEVSFAK
jgi:hypothetical protein